MAGPVFPWRDGNQFELLIDGPNFFPQMLVAIARAERAASSSASPLMSSE